MVWRNLEALEIFPVSPAVHGFTWWEIHETIAEKHCERTVDYTDRILIS